MTSAAWPLQKAVYDRLKEDATLAGLVGDGIYDDVPQDAAFPYVTIGDSTETDWSTKTSIGEAHTVTLHIWSRFGGRKEVKTIGARIKELLHEASLPLTANQLIEIYLDFSINIPEEDGVTYHGVMRFRALTEEH